MKTKLKSIHEESFSDKSKTIGVLLNYNEEENYKESFIFIFNEEKKIYIFFETIIDMIDYLMYGENKKKRAYLTEEEFDVYYDAPYIENEFKNVLTWLMSEKNL
jgi:hypothetical protein